MILPLFVKQATSRDFRGLSDLLETSEILCVPDEVLRDAHWVLKDLKLEEALLEGSPIDQSTKKRLKDALEAHLCGRLRCSAVQAVEDFLGRDVDNSERPWKFVRANLIKQAGAIFSGWRDVRLVIDSPAGLCERMDDLLEARRRFEDESIDASSHAPKLRKFFNSWHRLLLIREREEFFSLPTVRRAPETSRPQSEDSLKTHQSISLHASAKPLVTAYKTVVSTPIPSPPNLHSPSPLSPSYSPASALLRTPVKDDQLFQAKWEAEERKWMSWK